ncbi:MAG TPA: WD40 repeat domain-containing serine/threonine protein kinase, partial [Verrucomicrobiae bacterium]|nr:WD40 repeat domain-containing serine/threonine protein kinase [Verrucomicrobiae bacterium]
MSSKVIFDRTLEQALQRQRLRSTLPAQIADHQLLRPIAFGSYGDVWLGRNLLTGTFRAIKIIWRGAFDNTKPYEREFEGIRRFEPISRQHPGFVHILQTGLLGNGFYYIMELADDLHTGQKIEPGSYEASTLAGLPVAHLQHFSPENAIRIGIDLARSLEVLHGAGLIHRDIKPSNVIFINGQPKLGDIGLITVASDTNSAVGTYGFMAPEGPTNARSDIYSLGKLLYEIATGKDRLEFPNLPPGVSATEGLFAELNQVVTRACEPNPLNRYSSVRALQEELEFLLQGRSVKRIRQLEKALRWTKTSFGATMAVCAIAFVVFQSIQTKRTLAAKERERKIITALARGNERVEKGDFLAALTPFARAALMDSTPSEEDALRLGSTLAYAPKLLRTWKMEAEYSALSDDGTLLAAHAGPTIQVSDPVTGQVLRGIKDVALHSRVLGFNSEGNVLITAASNVLTFHSLRFGSEYQVPLNESARFFSRSRHGDLAITSSAGRVTLFPGKETLSGAGPVLKAFYSPSGHYIALIWGRGDGAIWDNLTKEFLPWAIRHADVIYNVFFTPNEERVLTMSFDRTARAWNMKTGEQAGFVMPHEDGVVFASQSPDDETLATASFDRTVKLWNASTYSPKAQNNILYHSAPLAWARFINSDLL